VFAGQSIEDYKGFLRLHVGRDGDLTIYPIRLAKVCHAWRVAPDDAPDDPWLRPTGEPLRAELIEARSACRGTACPDRRRWPPAGGRVAIVCVR